MANPFILAATTHLAAYILSALWQVPLLFVAGRFAARELRRVGPAIEHNVWQATLLLCVLVPAFPAPHLRGHSVVVTMSAADTTASEAETTGSPLAWLSPLSLPPVALRLLCDLWAASIFFGAIRLGVAMQRTRRLRDGASACVLPSAYAAAWQDCLQRSGLVRVTVLTSPAITGPVTISLGGPALLLPLNLVDDVTVEDFHAAAAHECAHIVRHDFRNNLLYGLLALPILFHPVSRFIRRHLVATREMACDRAAADMLEDTPAYRSALLRLAAWMAGTTTKPQTPTMGAAVGIFDSNSLEERMKRLAIIPPTIGSFGRYLLTTTIALFLMAVATAAAAGAVRVTPATAAEPAATPAAPIARVAVESPTSPTSSQTQTKPAATKPKVYSLDDDVTRPKLVHQVDPEFPPAFHGPEFWNGECVIGLVVDARGVPQDLHIAQSLDGGFDAKALEAVRQYRFAPATHNGRPVSVALKVSVNFAKF